MAVEAVITAGGDTKGALREYIVHHVMYHVPDGVSWNIPFVHFDFLDWFRYDSVMLATALVVLVFIFAVLYRRNQLVPHGWTNLLEVFVLFIRDSIAIEFLGEKDGRKMTPLFCTFFFFIAVSNLLGLLPFCSVATSNINVTGALAAVTLGFMVFGAIYKNGVLGFAKAFIPSGVPWPLLLILTPIEFISMLSKCFALMIRLFANMLAGHIIIYSLLGLVLILGYAALPVIFLGVAIYFFEVFIAFFQAYIFTLLSAIFIGSMYHPEH